MIRVLLLLLL